MSEPRSDPPQALSIALWQQREILGQLKNMLRQQHVPGEIQDRGVRKDPEKVISHLRTAELDRAIQASKLAREWGMEDKTTLRELTRKKSSEPWAQIFTMHLEALSTLVQDIRELCYANQSELSLPRTLLEFLQ